MSIQAIKDAWTCLEEPYKWIIGVLLTPIFICAIPLILLGVVLVLVVGAMIDGIDDWSAK